MPPPSPSLSFFLSYRRHDSPAALHVVRGLRDCGTRFFGEDAVFHDEQSIPLGAPWREVIQAFLTGPAACVIAVIGERWPELFKGTEETDWVVRELAEAHGCGRAVVPLLVGRVALPEAAAPTTPAELALAGVAHDACAVDFDNP